MIFNVSTGPCGNILMMSGYPRYSAVNEAIMLFTVVGLNLLLIPRHGLLGAVWAVGVGTIVVNALRVVQVWWHLRMHPYGWSTVRVLVASATMSAVLWWFTAAVSPASSDWFFPALASATALLIYGVVLVAAGLEDVEKDALRSIRQRLVPTRVRSQR